MKPIRHKFNAVSTLNDGIRFASKKESSFYNRLKTLQQAGEIIFFLRQVPLYLAANLRYTVDFVTFNADNTVHFIEVKGRKTPDYVMRKKLAEEKYPIEIEEV